MEFKPITISFSNYNSDVAELLIEKKKDKRFKQNDYVCECIRFFEKYKDKVIETLGTPAQSVQQNIDMNALKEMIEDTIDKKIKDINSDKKENDKIKLEENLIFSAGSLDDD